MAWPSFSLNYTLAATLQRALQKCLVDPGSLYRIFLQCINVGKP